MKLIAYMSVFQEGNSIFHNFMHGTYLEMCMIVIVLNNNNDDNIVHFIP
jgi:hypothetical protein